jgi:hypothetical protein
LQENEDIGKMISSGRLAKLEGELSMQKNVCEEMKKNQAEMDDFVQVNKLHLQKICKQVIKLELTAIDIIKLFG